MFFCIIVDNSILGLSSPRKLCLLLANLQLVSLPRVIIMATSNATFTPLCASCSDPGNSTCSGCYLVTVSRTSNENRARYLTNFQQVLRQNLSEGTLGHPRASLHVSTWQKLLAAGMGETATRACLSQRSSGEFKVWYREMALGQHTQRRYHQARAQ